MRFFFLPRCLGHKHDANPALHHGKQCGTGAKYEDECAAEWREWLRVAGVADSGGVITICFRRRH